VRVTDPANPRATRRRARLLLGIAAVLVGAVGAGVAGGWLMLDSHPLRAGLAGCTDVRTPGPRIDCLERRALELARDKGDATAVATLRRTVGRDHAIECHLAMHQLGERAAQRDGRSGFRSAAKDVHLRAGEPCDQGWIHGYLSVVFDEVTDEQLDEAIEACAAVATRTGECDHALGHALERSHRSTGADDAVHRCSLLAAITTSTEGRDAAARIHDCRHGAVMESALLDARRAHPAIDSCRGIDVRESRIACYEFLVARAVLLGDDWSRAARRCVALDDAGDRRACNVGFVDAAPDRATCDEHPSRDVRAACRKAKRR
jgi:hypothetical protein